MSTLLSLNYLFLFISSILVRLINEDGINLRMQVIPIKIALYIRNVHYRMFKNLVFICNMWKSV